MEEQAVAVKRRPGRPRKNPLPEMAQPPAPVRVHPWGEISVVPEEEAPPRPNLIKRYSPLAEELIVKLRWHDPRLTAVVPFENPEEAKQAGPIVLGLVNVEYGHGSYEGWISQVAAGGEAKLCIRRRDYWAK